MKKLSAWVLLSLSAVMAFAATPPLPETLPPHEFNQVFASVGDELFIAGQPTEQGLRELKAAGVTTVVNLRTGFEMDDRNIVPFDEAALLDELGMTYVHIPSGGPDTPYSAAMVERFAAVLDHADGKVLLHCTVAWRASHLYTAYLHRYLGLTLSEAVQHGRRINLGNLPLEGFLGSSIEFRVTEE